MQLALLATALAFAVAGLCRGREPQRAAWMFLLGPLFFLTWREADLDKDYLSAWLGAPSGVRMFSWKYLTGGAEMPGRLKWLFGLVSLGLVVLWLGACWRRRTAWRPFRQWIGSWPVWFWLLGAGIFLALPRLLEHSGLEKRWAPGVRDPYLEEAPELLGALAVLCFTLHFHEKLREQTSPAHPLPEEDR